MKRTVGRWTAIQTKLGATDDGDTPANRLWDWIERRTYGKPGQSQVAINLNHEKGWAELFAQAEKELPEGAELAR